MGRRKQTGQGHCGQGHCGHGAATVDCPAQGKTTAQSQTTRVETLQCHLAAAWPQAIAQPL